jgi:hypothetical protein
VSTGRDPARGYPASPDDLDGPEIEVLRDLWRRRRYAAVVAAELASSWRVDAGDVTEPPLSHPPHPGPVEHNVTWVHGSIASTVHPADPATTLVSLSATSGRVQVRCAESGATGALPDDPLLVDDAAARGVALLVHPRPVTIRDPRRSQSGEVVCLVPQRLHEGLLTWHAYRAAATQDYVGPGSGVGVKDCLRLLREQILHAEGAIDALGHRGQSARLRDLVDAIARDWLSAPWPNAWNRERAGALELAIPMIAMADAALAAPSPSVTMTDEARRRRAITEVRRAAVDVFEAALRWDRESP